MTRAAFLGLAISICGPAWAVDSGHTGLTGGTGSTGDTGLVQTGDTGLVDTAIDTAISPLDTAISGVDTGLDTGTSDTGTGANDTGTLTTDGLTSPSAASLAGETGGFSCDSAHSVALWAFALPLGILLGRRS